MAIGPVSHTFPSRMVNDSPVCHQSPMTCHLRLPTPPLVPLLRVTLRIKSLFLLKPPSLVT